MRQNSHSFATSYSHQHITPQVITDHDFPSDLSLASENDNKELKKYLQTIFATVLVDIIVEYHIPLWCWEYKYTLQNSNHENLFIMDDRILSRKDAVIEDIMTGELIYKGDYENTTTYTKRIINYASPYIYIQTQSSLVVMNYVEKKMHMTYSNIGSWIDPIKYIKNNIVYTLSQTNLQILSADYKIKKVSLYINRYTKNISTKDAWFYDKFKIYTIIADDEDNYIVQGINTALVEFDKYDNIIHIMTPLATLYYYNEYNIIYRSIDCFKKYYSVTLCRRKKFINAIYTDSLVLCNFKCLLLNRNLLVVSDNSNNIHIYSN